MPSPEGKVPQFARNCGMIATGNHFDYVIRCALQHWGG